MYQPDNYEWRVDQAKKMRSALIRADLHESIPVLVDEMDNPVWCTYGPLPNGAYLINPDGKVIEKEGWYNPSDMEIAIKGYLGE